VVAGRREEGSEGEVSESEKGSNSDSISSGSLLLLWSGVSPIAIW
jgi:hypothetical protein